MTTKTVVSGQVNLARVPTSSADDQSRRSGARAISYTFVVERSPKSGHPAKGVSTRGAGK